MSVSELSTSSQCGSLRWEHYVGAIGLILLAIGQYMGLFWSPPERMMGDVGRMLFTHVPAAWISLLAYTAAFLGALTYLFTSRRGADAFILGCIEVGVLLNVLLLIEGSLFAKPTWGVWWTWDPRLTLSAVMLLTFVGVLTLRRAVSDPETRASWTAIATIPAYMTIILTYYSVKWWKSLHQLQSSPETVDPSMTLVLRINAIAYLVLAIWLIAARTRVAKTEAQTEMPPLPPVEEAP